MTAKRFQPTAELERLAGLLQHKLARRFSLTLKGEHNMNAETPQQPAAVLIVACPHCGRTLTEQFDRGQMYCGACDVSWPVSSILRDVQDLTNLLLAEMSAKGEKGHVQRGPSLCPIPAIAG